MEDVDVPTVLYRSCGWGKVSDPVGTGEVPRSVYSRVQRPRVVHCLSERHYGEHSWYIFHIAGMLQPMRFIAYIHTCVAP